MKGQIYKKRTSSQVSPNSERRIIVAQLGARRHYAVPKIMYAAGILDYLGTDLCAIAGWPKLLKWLPKRLLPAVIRRLLGRDPGIPRQKVVSLTWFGWRYYRLLKASKTRSEFSAAVLWGGKAFNEILSRRGLGQATDLYAYNGAALELFRVARKQKVRCILDQTMVPFQMERQILSMEQGRWPGWESPLEEDANHQRLCKRELEEWELADIILCGSRFDVAGIRASGGDASKCVVVPRGISLPQKLKDKSALSQPRSLRILTVGAVCLRKGAPYIYKAACELQDVAQFRMVGQVNLKIDYASELRNVVDLAGTVPRSEMESHYQWADVFLLPSVCEGSATAVYEASAYGLPVICTPNAGSAIEDGEDGIIIPKGDSRAIVNAVRRLQERDVLMRMRRRALKNRPNISLDAYAQRLLGALGL